MLCLNFRIVNLAILMLPFDDIKQRSSYCRTSPPESTFLAASSPMLLDYCGMRGAAPGPLFCECDLRPVTISSFNTELKRCLVFCGLDTSRYKGHSFRIGAATHASEQGFSDSQIRKLGRWQSDAFKTYLRSGALSANAQND